MKIFKDNICYVQAYDLMRYSLPEFIKADILKQNIEDLIPFKDKESIEYLMNRKDILNYGEVSKLSDIELEKKIKEIYALLEPYIKNKSKESMQNKEFKEKYNLYRYIYYGLLNYRDDRSNVDEYFEKQFLPKEIKKK